ncbi:gonadotropin-releasing hormone II receptor-like [Heteronotia binoei]|uniref:gonadotropin-releasing hormone II receptor-like n=1 Tax=Heteronotia binoei TaxID=13085 RepID=UPI00292CB6B8|nr:gonadotropin-releasing hormone II receptor-like [Heteronotia binoei]
MELAAGLSGSPRRNGSQEGALPPLPTFSSAALARVVLTLLLCALATAGNAAVLRAGLAAAAGRGGRGRRGLSPARRLLLHLAGADLLVALVAMPLDAAWNLTVEWRGGDGACRLLMFLKLLAMYAAAFLTALVSLDRHAALRHPLALAAAPRRPPPAAAAAWLLSAALALPQLFLFRAVTVGSPPRTFTQCSTRGSFARRWHEAAYNLLTFAGLFLLPLLVMVACYARILRHIARHARSGPPSAPELPLRRSRNPIPQARLRMLRLSVAIVGSFVVCWTPYYLLGLWYWFWPAAMEGTVSHSLAHLLFLFGLLNACLDPLLYGLFTTPWPPRRPWLQGCRPVGGRGPQPPTASSCRSSPSTACARRDGGPPRGSQAPLALGQGPPLQQPLGRQD